MVTNGMCRYIVSGGRVGATGAAGAGAGACRMRVGTAFGARRVGARRIGVAGAMFIGVWGVCCSTGGEGGAAASVGAGDGGLGEGKCACAGGTEAGT